MNTNRTMTNICARTKVVAAAIAAGVVVTMGALTVALSGTEAHAVTAPLGVGGGGDTSTQATPPPVPPTADAKPPVKAKKWQGNGWPGQ